eukprot:Skav216150  [mRNA]  locus=scaffold3056:48607:53830:+ [translate_table: standard]
MRENFQQEVGIMKELDHPNICTVYESYDHGRHVYLVMEYCAGVRGIYTSACDIWSLGAMACVMLTGEPPFFGTKVEEDSTGAAAWDTGPQATSGAAWESISEGARNWVASLLRWNPTERLSAEEVLSHPWLKTLGSASDLHEESPRHRFSNTSTFLSLCAASVAQQLSRKGLKELQTVTWRDMLKAVVVSESGWGTPKLWLVYSFKWFILDNLGGT